METIVYAKLLLSFVFLGYASWSDIKTREVSNKIWIFYGPLGLLLTLFEGILQKDTDFWILFGISVAVTWILAITLFYVGAYGGADAKAFMCLALVFPTCPQTAWKIQHSTFHMLFPVTVFTNSILLAALSVIYMLLRNLFWKLGEGRKLFNGLEKEPFWKKILTILCGYKVSIEKLREKDFYFPLEDIEEREGGGKRVIVVFPRDEDRENILKRLDRIENDAFNGYVWASPGLPMLVFITLGFIAALFLGDLIWFLVSLFSGFF
ncbi:hypothetical protein DRO54_01225 [Candidatus Bathyarchaeota archaeon]|nr:MAG: hypothetical protein DRO54_01225 [Candidatus Bathyarchaeota archaeon]